MADRPEDVHYLRGLAARLRSLAMTEPNIADRVRQIADETDDRADAMAARLTRRGHST
jgi:hypothetical protein